MTDPAAPTYYPVSLDVTGRHCLVVGGGPVAARKARGLVACGARVTPVVVETVAGIFDVNELRISESAELRENDIGVLRLRTATPLAVDPYEADRITGSFVLIDEQSFATIAAGMVGPPRLHD